MKNASLCFVLVAFVIGGTVWCRAGTKVETTMSVARCQAVLENGRQCANQASEGKRFCWRHRGAVQSLDNGCTAAGKGANSAWQATKTWTTNAVEKTRRSTEKAMDSTREAFREAGDEFTNLMRKTFKKDTQKTGTGK